MPLSTLLYYLKKQVSILEEIIEVAAPAVHTDAGMSEEQYRAIDWRLIQIASWATRWIESLRDECRTEMANRKETETTNG